MGVKQLGFSDYELTTAKVGESLPEHLPGSDGGIAQGGWQRPPALHIDRTHAYLVWNRCISD